MDNINNIPDISMTSPQRPEGKKKINKLVFLAIILVVAIIFAEGVGLVYFANESQKLSKQSQDLKGLKPDLEKLTREEKSLKSEYDQLQKKFKALEQDRNNLINRIKGLLAQESKTSELEKTIETIEVEKISLRGEISELREDNMVFEADLGKLKQSHIRIGEERDGLKALYNKAKSKGAIVKLKKQLSSMQRKYKNIIGDLKKTQVGLIKSQKTLEKTQATVVKLTEQNSTLADNKDAMKLDLTEKIKKYMADYDDVAKKNVMMERDMKNMPKKFAEIARQNKRLTSETSKMHYNLGVFYTKNKEYNRAVEEFKKAADINPDDANTHFNLGYIYAEYIVNREKAIKHFRYFLQLAKADDQDVDWARKYLLTWEAFNGKTALK